MPAISMTSFRTLTILGLAVLLTGCASTTAQRPVAAGGPAARLNPYILEAVAMLYEKRKLQGYGSAAFTQDLAFGNNGTLKASKAPLTMCVAAQLEVLVEALSLYSTRTNDYNPFSYLPKASWSRLRPSDLRGQIWIVRGAPSNGAADALFNHGMGEKTTFEKLQPGDFLNFNRTNGSGHGVIFLAYLDAAGNTLPEYSSLVAGFQYFSSQGKEMGGGLDYRYAFFDPICPALTGKKRDCGVIRSPSQKLLNTGYAWMPVHWDKTKVRVRPAPAGRPEPEGAFDEGYFTGTTTDE